MRSRSRSSRSRLPLRGRVDLIAAEERTPRKQGSIPQAVVPGAGRGRSQPQPPGLEGAPMTQSRARGRDCHQPRRALLLRIVETFEGGISLGPKVKALREGKAACRTVRRDRGGRGLPARRHIPPYAPASRENHEPERPRKLLMHRWEIERLIGRMQRKGLTLIPTSIYFKGNEAKVELALARGKKQRDQRRQIRDRDVARDVERELKTEALNGGVQRPPRALHKRAALLLQCPGRRS